MSLEMITKGKQIHPIAGEFDDEMIMTLFATFEIEVKPPKGKKQPLLEKLESLTKADFGPLREHHVVSDGGEYDDEEPNLAWQSPKVLLKALETFRTALDLDEAPYLVQQIWTDHSKAPPDPPDLEAIRSFIGAVDDLIARVNEAIRVAAPP
ncbi:hypothetical protein [Nannocystis pusilla]|uniref:hypothetical protein n=1 Tax=Nannocystis pusilla TaxID=889268 RepID=UPI003BF3BFA1